MPVAESFAASIAPASGPESMPAAESFAASIAPASGPESMPAAESFAAASAAVASGPSVASSPLASAKEASTVLPSAESWRRSRSWRRPHRGVRPRRGIRLGPRRRLRPRRGIRLGPRRGIRLGSRRRVRPRNRKIPPGMSPRGASDTEINASDPVAASWPGRTMPPVPPSSSEAGLLLPPPHAATDIARAVTANSDPTRIENSYRPTSGAMGMLHGTAPQRRGLRKMEGASPYLSSTSPLFVPQGVSCGSEQYQYKFPLKDCLRAWRSSRVFHGTAATFPLLHTPTRVGASSLETLERKNCDRLGRTALCGVLERVGGRRGDLVRWGRCRAPVATSGAARSGLLHRPAVRDQVGCDTGASPTSMTGTATLASIPRSRSSTRSATRSGAPSRSSPNLRRSIGGWVAVAGIANGFVYFYDNTQPTSVGEVFVPVSGDGGVVGGFSDAGDGGEAGGFPTFNFTGAVRANAARAIADETGGSRRSRPRAPVPVEGQLRLRERRRRDASGAELRLRP